MKLNVWRISHINKCWGAFNASSTALKLSYPLTVDYYHGSMENPWVKPLEIIYKRVLRYLKYTRDMTLTHTWYSKALKSHIQAWLSTPLQWRNRWCRLGVEQRYLSIHLSLGYTIVRVFCMILCMYVSFILVVFHIICSPLIFLTSTYSQNKWNA